MHLSPDDIIYWQFDFIKISATLVWTWVIMALLVVSSMLITRKITLEGPRSRWQNMLEIIVTTISGQIRDIGLTESRHYLSFLGTLFLFVASAALLTVVPGYEPPTGSLSTTAALALCVFFAVPLFGIQKRGLHSYLASYMEPSVIMLPFNLISELSRTLALAVRLFGNMMSGGMILAILLAITPFVFPVILTMLGLLTGMVQAYIFFVLGGVYIAAATQNRSELKKPEPSS
jgi:F-type H+-transporting ATPase subunit a